MLTPWQRPRTDPSESGDVIKVEDWAEIRRLHRAEGMPINAIARRLRISRDGAPGRRARQASGRGRVRGRTVGREVAATTSWSAAPPSTSGHGPAPLVPAARTSKPASRRTVGQHHGRLARYLSTCRSAPLPNPTRPGPSGSRRVRKRLRGFRLPSRHRAARKHQVGDCAVRVFPSDLMSWGPIGARHLR